MPSNHLILCRPLLLLPSIFDSIRVFSSESFLCIRWPKYWSVSFSISPSNEYSGLISFKMDWFDLLTVQGTLKSLLQHYSSKASILWCSAFFMVQLSVSQSVQSLSHVWFFATPWTHRMSSSHIPIYQPRGGHYSPWWSHIWGGPTWKGREEAGFLLMSLSGWIYLRPTLPVDFILCDIINSWLLNQCWSGWEVDQGQGLSPFLDPVNWRWKGRAVSTPAVFHDAGLCCHWCRVRC